VSIVPSSAGQTCAAARIGYWASLLTGCFCIVFTIAAVLTESHMLPMPWDVVLTIGPSLLLAPCFLAVMVCVNALAPAERKIWSQLGVAFACVYVPMCVSAYGVELAVVEPRIMRGNTSETALITLVRSDSVFNAIDGIGYLFMCLSTLVAAPAFAGTRLERAVRRVFVANGLLAVPIGLTYFVDRSFLVLAALWSVTITLSAILLAIHFRRIVRATRGPAASERDAIRASDRERLQMLTGSEFPSTRLPGDFTSSPDRKPL
jgi:hypothetical protein